MEEDDKIYNLILDKAIEEHLKEGFAKFGIEGTEEVFCRVYASIPKILERYQEIYNRLIGRAK